MAGLRTVSDTVREPRLGLAAARDSAGAVLVTDVVPGSTAEAAGVRAGDVLLSLGDISITDPNFGPRFRERFARDSGQALPIQVKRDTQTVTLTGKVQFVARVQDRLELDPSAPEKAVRIRQGIFQGR